MTYTSLVMKFVASMILAASLAVSPTKTYELKVTEIEYPVEVVATTTPPRAVVRRQVAVQGDCTEYASLLERYDWATSTAMEICKHESKGNPKAIGDKNTAHVSCGLMQIRTLADRPTCEELFDPELNIEIAYAIWKESGWVPWLNTARKIGVLD